MPLGLIAFVVFGMRSLDGNSGGKARCCSGVRSNLADLSGSLSLYFSEDEIDEMRRGWAQGEEDGFRRDCLRYAIKDAFGLEAVGLSFDQRKGHISWQEGPDVDRMAEWLVSDEARLPEETRILRKEPDRWRQVRFRLP